MKDDIILISVKGDGQIIHRKNVKHIFFEEENTYRTNITVIYKNKKIGYGFSEIYTNNNDIILSSYSNKTQKISKNNVTAVYNEATGKYHFINDLLLERYTFGFNIAADYIPKKSIGVILSLNIPLGKGSEITIKTGLYAISSTTLLAYSPSRKPFDLTIENCAGIRRYIKQMRRGAYLGIESGFGIHYYQQHYNHIWDSWELTTRTASYPFYILNTMIGYKWVINNLQIDANANLGLLYKNSLKKNRTIPRGSIKAGVGYQFGRKYGIKEYYRICLEKAAKQK